MEEFNSEYNDNNDRKYSNDEITVYWYPKKCIHATTCYKELIEVFNPRKRPWVDMSGAPTNEIIRVVDMCPTQALAYKWNKSITETSDKGIASENEVRIMEDGPMVIKGDFKIIGTDGKEHKKMKMASICRCGASMKMPFCDGTHRKIGFAGK